MDQIKSQHGLSILEGLIAQAIILIATIPLLVLINKYYYQGRDLAARESMLQIREQIEASLRNNDAWAATVTNVDNAALSCLRLAMDCNGVSGAFKLSDATGAVLVDSLSATSGFTFDGSACATYTAAGDDDCPIHVEVSWRAMCSAVGCISPMAQASVSFTYSPEKAASFNMTGMELTVYR